jgi:hypothetical protein
MNNKEVCERLNKMLQTMKIFERVFKLNRKQSVIERYVVVNEVEIKVNSKLSTSNNWDNENDVIPSIAFRKEKREKLIKFLENNEQNLK